METLVVLLDYHRGPVSVERLRSVWSSLRHLVEGLPLTTSPLSVTLADARLLPLESQSVDLVITSPPYINVFNYHQQYRASVEALDWEVLPLARSEIGANRKHRGNRFLLVIQYCLDMAQVFVELARVCRLGARAIFIVGRESNVRKTPFYNGQILHDLASECLGLTILLQQERVFQNRFGRNIFEDILHVALRPIDPSRSTERARSLATRILSEARSRAPYESHDALDAALQSVESVQPSPLMDLSDQPWALLRGFAYTKYGGRQWPFQHHTERS